MTTGKDAPRTYTLSDVPASIDTLDFAPYIRTLIKIIASPNTATPLTIGVFGTWGSGKTSLMRMVSKDLPENFHTVWFDAWKYDKEDALWRALLLQVLTKVRSLAEVVEPFAKKEIEDHKKVLEALDDLEASLYRSVEREQLGELQINWQELMKGSLETAIHVGIALVPGLNIVQKVMEEVGTHAVTKDPGRLLKAVEREKTRIYTDHVRSLEQFQEKFKGLVDRLIRQQNTKLVVFIDDLDRCEPEKAIAVLEAIKLFLDVEGCVFVLGLDQEVVTRGVELKYRELGLVNEESDKSHFVVEGARYLEKIIQLPFQIPPIEREDMHQFVHGLVKDWPDENCSSVFAEGLGDNPRQVKRAVNVFLLLSALAQEREEKLKGRIKPLRLAKVVIIQSVYPELYQALKVTPRLLRDLEAYYRAEVSRDEQKTRPPGGLKDDVMRLEPPPMLAYLINRSAVRRILTMHPSYKADANFIDQSPDELRLYFTLTRRAEATLNAPSQTTPIRPEMVRIPAGTFLMGSTNEQIDQVVKSGMDPDWAMMEAPQHKLDLPEYFIGKYPVTNMEYQAFVKDTNRTPPKDWAGVDFPQNKGDHPVVYISFLDALTYCQWLANKTGKPYRLPSEAEWEKAARGENGLVFPWGDTFEPDRCNTRESEFGTTSPVDLYSPQGDSPYGCADMAGNVWEWTLSQKKEYPYKVDDGREDLKKITIRVLRGGSYGDSLRGARCACRLYYGPGDGVMDYSFRVALTPSVSEI